MKIKFLKILFIILFINTTIQAGIFYQSDWSGDSNIFSDISGSLNWYIGENVYINRDNKIILDVKNNLEPSLTNRIEIITADDDEGVGALATDGTYIYSVSWNSYDSNDRTLSKIGTGYNGTVKGKVYGNIASTHQAISLAYVKDDTGPCVLVGYSTNGYNLQRINLTDGSVTYQNIPGGILVRNTGYIGGSSAALITSDGTYLYTIAYEINNGGYNGWTVRKIDPDLGYNCVDSFTVSATSFYADGVVCDGRYICPIQWGGSRYMNRINLKTYAIDGVWTTDQGANSVINGQYDRVNNKVWLGNLYNNQITKYEGNIYFETGTLISYYLNTNDTSIFQNISFSAETSDSCIVKIQIETASDLAGNPDTVSATGFLGPSSTADYYTNKAGDNINNSHNDDQWVHYKIFLSTSDSNLSPVLNSISINYYPFTNNPPNNFSLLTPTNGTDTNALRPELCWQNNGDADGDTLTYKIIYSTGSDFDSYNIIDEITSNSYTFTFDLNDNTKYYWRVIAYDKYYAEKFCNETDWYFIVNQYNDTPPAPGVIEPENNSNINVLRPEFSFYNSADVDPGDILTYDIQISSDSVFLDIKEEKSNIAEDSIITKYTPDTSLLYNHTYYWRVRANDGTANSNWSNEIKFNIVNAWVQTDWISGDGQTEWSDFSKFLSDTKINYSNEGEIRIETQILPQPSGSTRSGFFTTENSRATGNIAADGTYLYVKSWSSYDGNELEFTKIGTGYNGTDEGIDYGTLATVSASITSACIGGYIYNGYTSTGFNLQRVKISNGAVDFVSVPAGLIRRSTGQQTASDNALLITADENYIYNIAYEINNGGYNGFTVKVFDPNNNFTLITSYTSGTSSFYTDGCFCDGDYLYFIEWGGGRRIRRIKALTGEYSDEWVSDQASSNIIHGHFDFINNVVWLGGLTNSSIYKYKGKSFYSSGELISSIFNAGAPNNYSLISWQLDDYDTRFSINFQLRTGSTISDLQSNNWLGPQGSDTLYYTEPEEMIYSGHNGDTYVQYKVVMTSSDTNFTPVLKESVVYMYPVGFSPPDTFSLVSPVSGQETDTYYPEFDWQDSNDSMGGSIVYTLWVSNDMNFSNKYIFEDIPSSIYRIDTPLTENKKYYWKVKAENEYGAITWCDETDWSFYVNAINDTPTVPEMYFPEDNGLVTGLLPTLTIYNSYDSDPIDTLVYDFEIANDSMFNDIADSGYGITEGNRMTDYTLVNQLLYNQDYYWRVRADDQKTKSGWSQKFIFTVSNGWTQTDWSSGAGQILWNDIRKYDSDTNVNISFEGEFCIQGETATQPNLTNLLTTVAVENSQAVGALAADGTYLYCKSWGTYDGNDQTITKIGSGYNETVEGKDYGDLAAVNRSIAMTYIPGGYIINGYSSNGYNLERVEIESGNVDYVSITSGLIRRNTGLQTAADNALLITSDGRYLYNAAYSIENGGYNGFTIKIFDLNDYNLVETIYNTGSSFYTDGIFCDGQYIYMIEWGGSRRIRQISLSDSSTVNQWTSAQASTGEINGQYDWINNKVWTGSLYNPEIFKYNGFTYFDTSELISSVFDAGAPSNFQFVNWQSVTNEGSIKIQIRSSVNYTDIFSESWRGPDGTDTSYYFTIGTEINDEHNGDQFVQYRVVLSTNTNDTSDFLNELTPVLKRITITMFPTTVNPPNEFSLISPVKAGFSDSLNTTVTWEEALDSDTNDEVTYILWYDENSDFSNRTEIEEITDTGYTINTLTEDHKYYWKILAKDKYGAQTWCTETDWYFIVDSENEQPSPPTIYYPANGANVESQNPTLRVTNSYDSDPYDILTYCFEVYNDPGYSDLLIKSDSVSEEAGITNWSLPILLEFDKTYYWRCRAYDGDVYSTWTNAQFSTVQYGGWTQTDWSNGDGQEQWKLNSASLDEAKYYTDTDCEIYYEGELRLTPITFPEPRNTTEANNLLAENSEAVGAIATDGNYLYTKSWGTYDSNDNIISKIGSGYHSTIAGKDYGDLATVNQSISMTYIPSGYILNGYSSTGYNLQRVKISDGTVDMVSVPDGLIRRNTGLQTAADNALLITSDGKYLYNVAYEINNGGYNGFTIRVYDLSNFSLVREFTSGTNSFYVDGIFCDGKYIYMIQWGSSHYIRRIDLATGIQNDQWVCNQAATSEINGQYDWENNRVWLGALTSSNIYEYYGFKYEQQGELVSSIFNPGTRCDFDTISFDAEIISSDTTKIKFQLRSGNSVSAVNDTDWVGPTDSSDFYTTSDQPINDIHKNKKYLQYRIILETTDTTYTPVVNDVTINYTPKKNEGNYINISHSGSALARTPEPVTVSIKGDNGSIISYFSGKVTITTNGNPSYVTWTLNSGNGSLNTDTPGVAAYTFAAADNGQVVLDFQYDRGAVINFSASAITESLNTIIEKNVLPLTVSDNTWYEFDPITDPLVKNVSFNVTVYSMLDVGIDTSYNQTADVYVLDGSGTVTPLIVNFIDGVCTATFNYSNDDSMRLKLVDQSDNTIYGISSVLSFSDSYILKLELEQQDYYVSGNEYKITVSALTVGGIPISSYNGPAYLKQSSVDYIEPTTGTKEVQKNNSSGDITINNFSGGIAEIYIHYDDAGTIAFRVQDDTAVSNSCTPAIFVPEHFDISITNNFDTAGSAFDLNITAQSSNNEITGNYNSNLNFTVNFVDPDSYSIARNIPLFSTADNIFNGTLSLTQKYDEAGIIRIKVSDETYCKDTVIISYSDTILFLPQKIQVNITSPPPNRNFYYLTEPWLNTTISVYNINNELTRNFNRQIIFDNSVETYPFNLPASYTFEPDTDKGQAEFLNYFISINEGTNTIKIISKDNNNIMDYDEVIVKYAKIKILNNVSPVGETVYVRCEILDRAKNIISQDNSSRFKINFINSSTAVSDAITDWVNINNGFAEFPVYSNKSEKVEVTPIPENSVPADTESGIVTFIDYIIKIKDTWRYVPDNTVPAKQIVKVELLNKYYFKTELDFADSIEYTIDTGLFSDSTKIINPDEFVIRKNNSYDTFFVDLLPGAILPIKLKIYPVSYYANPETGTIEFINEQKKIKMLRYNE